ncbi:TlpA family protein disulfide reductase [Tamlana sp. s12]|uniref:TlpA family protein disulfide reductase n=1 Tax=Tamlana sp. s12 TaxID=1630406 RepID=UPI0007FFF8AC|nr:TlpA disulfide reductase family protein [Tamlana sp. s12]OBQ56510.1 thiol-disulfide oxidoreductase [Tamlana sp. s12]QQY81863.1 TlpA family protein disulfide reductase [Tamlana sp. s12]
MKSNFSTKNILFIVVIVLLLIPQTRHPIQVWLNKGLALFSPAVVDENKQAALTDYKWALQTKSGKIISFEQSKGKVVLLNFWATWCAPCIAEMPSLQLLYEDYKDQVDFVFVSSDPPEKIKAFIKKEGYTFETYTIKSQLPDLLDVTNIPRTFLIDQSGHIIIDKTGAANWNSETVRTTIDALLDRKV